MSRAGAVFLLLILLTAGATAAGPYHLAPGVVQHDGRLVVGDPAGGLTLDLDGWQPLPDPPPGLIVLRRLGEGRNELRLLDRHGRELGTVEIPDAWTGFATESGVVLVPEALHEARRPHWLKFLAFTGDRRAEVHESELTLIDWAVAPGGGLVTVSQAPGDGTRWVILAYDGQGAEIWRHAANGVTPPEAVLAAGGQLAVLESDLPKGISTVTLLARDREPASYQLSNVTQMVADPDSPRVAVVGQDVVALFDTRTCKLLWRRDEPIDFVLHGGVRFDHRAGRLLVVNADRDRQAGTARLGLRSYGLGGGGPKRAALGEAPVDALPTVVDVETAIDGGHRVVLHDRIVTAVPDGTP
jgi:hypothetical protein